MTVTEGELRSALAEDGNARQFETSPTAALEGAREAKEAADEAAERAQKSAEQASQLQTFFRGVPLILIVVAVIGYPLYAMIYQIPPQDLAQYVAPITGLAGAMVGYWFGSGSTS